MVKTGKKNYRELKSISHTICYQTQKYKIIVIRKGKNAKSVGMKTY